MTPAELFIKVAAEHVGPDGHDWVLSMISNLKPTAGWCAATMSAIGQACGFGGKIMPKRETSAGWFGYYTVKDYGGTYHKGGFAGADNYTTDYIPKKGDLFFIQMKTKNLWKGQGTYGWGSTRTVNIPDKSYQSTHVGVVEYVDKNNIVHTIEGNHKNQYCRRTLKLSKIAWYVTPAWNKVSSQGPGAGSGGDQQITLKPESTISPRDKFIQVAADHISGGHDWVTKVSGIPSRYAWCAATMCAVAKTCKDLKGNTFAGQIMPGDEWVAAAFGMKVVENYGGKYITGGKYGESESPQPGDLFQTQNGDGSGSPAAAGLPQKYQSKHIGVVERVDSKTIYTIEGNHEGKYSRGERSRSSIAWYARPKWSKISGVDGVPIDPTQTSEPVTLLDPDIYDSVSTRADATLREVGYLTSGGKPSITPTDTRLCAINYTGMVSALAKMLSQGDAVTQQTVDDISKLPTIPKCIVNYLVTNLKVNTAVAVGITSNIKWTSLYTLPKSTASCIGAFGWPKVRGLVLKGVLGSNWETDMNGQLDFLMSELSTTFSEMLLKFMLMTNSDADAENSAELFRTTFGSSFKLTSDEVSATSKYLWGCVDQKTVSVADGVSPSGSTDGLHARKSLTLVEKFKIGENGSPYDSPKNRVYRAWETVGKPSNKGVATINNYYVVTCPKSYGNIGDIVQFRYSNGYLNCVVASHSTDGKVAFRTKGRVSIDFPGLGKTVTEVFNYGNLV